MSDDQHLTLRPATTRDVPALLSLMDSILAWLVARGRTEQWGTVPFSRIPGFENNLTEWTSRGVITVAERGGAPVGVLALAPAVPPHIPSGLLPPGALFVHTVMSARGPAGRGAGEALLREASRRAEAQGAPGVGLDHWAGSPELDRIYDRHGYVKVGEYKSEKDGRAVLNTVRIRHL
ncbi:GNAT family N-acetyltransferase [Nonomuraea candida]|uniref:GNAT family N-acetyltransferase n=1 Tax=Nonomuraea candida TaxID=359159 RepID=UPI0006948E27|nr:GNAT family N-acetyltransferase [Nonomuraea candida]